MWGLLFFLRSVLDHLVEEDVDDHQQEEEEGGEEGGRGDEDRQR